MTTVTSSYALDNSRSGAGNMLDCLSVILDQSTVDLIAPLVQPGVRCLELGAGNGSMARWLADAAGTDGRVVALDIDPDLVRAEVRTRPQVEVLRHDLRTDPLPAG